MNALNRAGMKDEKGIKSDIVMNMQYVNDYMEKNKVPTKYLEKKNISEVEMEIPLQEELERDRPPPEIVRNPGLLQQMEEIPEQLMDMLERDKPKR